MIIGKKILLLFVVFVAVCLHSVRAWEELDFEIFELWDAIKKKDGTVDWYGLVGVKDNDSVDTINKAYRKLSIKYHPDKLRGTPKEKKVASDKFARLGLVVNMLRDSYKRKRYNFFKKNGVPVWRGAGYMYKRYRPGAVSVIIGLSIFAAFIQYLFMSLSYWRAQQRIKDFEQDQQPPKANVVNSGRKLNHYSLDPEFYEEDQEMFTGSGINPYTVPKPQISDLFLVKLPLSLINMVTHSSKKTDIQIQIEDENRNPLNPKNKSKAATNSPRSESRDNSALSSDNEFNAVLVKKSLSKESSAEASSSSKKSLKKRRKGPVV
ncbi:putative J domain-containing protein [Smittium mucronatum]|uniref:Putative J domain-containing protein n=1 Tax=Smittium mucronatum TaxID=133383 RepID=A0A1R0GSW2_9FUNG|nr:putative J domain-containing protein [Smittium mucronatum]